MIPEIKAGQITAVFGPVASGKSFLLQQWAQTSPRVGFFDTVGDHVDNTLMEHIWANPRALADRLEEVKDGPYKLCYHPGANAQSGFDWFVSLFWQLDHDRNIFIEEIHEFMNPHTQHPKMKLLNKYARKRAALGVIGCSQRIADVHKDFTSAARLNVLFHTTEAPDLRSIFERWGEEVEQAVLNLRHLDYDDATGVVRQTPQAVLIRRGEPFEIIEVG